MIKEILGFADFPADTRYPTLELLGKGIISAFNPGATSAYVTSVQYNNRRWLRIFGTTAPYLRMDLKNVGITNAEAKTRKIYGGFRYVISNNAAFEGATILFFSRATSYNLLTDSQLTAMQGEAYIEYMIDIPNLTFKVWVDGVMRNSGPLNTAETASTSEGYMHYGQTASSQTSELHYYNDFYWLVDTSDLDDTPSSRLGPVKVGAVKVDTSVVPTDWVVPEGATPATVLDTTTLGPNGEVSPVIRTSPAESVASFSFAKPDTAFPIRAVSIEMYGYRDTGTVPVIESQLRQGEAVSAKQTQSLHTSVLREGANANRIGCLNKDLNNLPWTVDSIDQLEVLINSKTGS